MDSICWTPLNACSAIHRHCSAKRRNIAAINKISKSQHTTRNVYQRHKCTSDVKHVTVSEKRQVQMRMSQPYVRTSERRNGTLKTQERHALL